MSEQAKIGYKALPDGHWTTGYVTIDDSGNRATGENKHSDEPITAVWDENQQAWLEI